MQGLHPRGGLTEITNRVVMIAERSIAQAAPVDRHRLFIVLAEASPDRGGLVELLDGLAQRDRCIAGAQLLAFTDRAFSRDASPVFGLCLSRLGHGYKVFAGRRELGR